LALYDDQSPLSLAHLSELDLPPDALAEVAARAGFASIGIRTIPAVPGGAAYPLDTVAARAALRRRLRDTGVSVLYIEMIALAPGLRPADHHAALEIGAELGATRLAVSGNDTDRALLADQFATLCDLARPLGISVDLEFMPFRAVATLADALGVVEAADRPNGHVLVDALHVFRSRTPLAEIAATAARRIGTVQLCDAPAIAPTGAEALATEARTARMLPGQGGLDLRALIAALPDGIPLGLEIPLAGQFPALDPAARADLMVRTTREYLRAR
jgi:sugar phosphate isomerase/epimerase